MRPASASASIARPPGRCATGVGPISPGRHVARRPRYSARPRAVIRRAGTDQREMRCWRSVPIRATARRGCSHGDDTWGGAGALLRRRSRVSEFVVWTHRLRDGALGWHPDERSQRRFIGSRHPQPVEFVVIVNADRVVDDLGGGSVADDRSSTARSPRPLLGRGRAVVLGQDQRAAERAPVTRRSPAARSPSSAWASPELLGAAAARIVRVRLVAGKAQVQIHCGRAPVSAV